MFVKYYACGTGIIGKHLSYRHVRRQTKMPLIFDTGASKLQIESGLPLPLAIVAICYLKCRVATNRSLAKPKSTVLVVQKLHICKRVYFDQLLEFQILLLLLLHTYYCAIFNSLDAGFFQYHPGIKQFGSRSGLTFCLP